MNLIDSSGWLEYFSDGLNADVFVEPIIASSEPIIIPTIIICLGSHINPSKNLRLIQTI